MKYSWKIKEIVKKDFGNKKDVIFKIFWEKIGVDENENMGTAQGTTLLNIEDSNFDQFIEYENLTEENVLEWILLTIPENYDKKLNRKILNKIEQLKNPSTKVSEFPWSN